MPPFIGEVFLCFLFHLVKFIYFVIHLMHLLQEAFLASQALLGGIFSCIPSVLQTLLKFNTDLSVSLVYV